MSNWGAFAGLEFQSSTVDVEVLAPTSQTCRHKLTNHTSFMPHLLCIKVWMKGSMHRFGALLWVPGQMATQVWRLHNNKPSPSHHRWYVYQSQSWVVYSCSTHINTFQNISHPHYGCHENFTHSHHKRGVACSQTSGAHLCKQLEIPHERFCRSPWYLPIETALW